MTYLARDCRVLIQVVAHTVVTAWLENGALNIAKDPKLIRMFADSHGRLPRPGELKQNVARYTQRFGDRLDLLASGIRNGIEEIPRILAKSSVQLVSAEGISPVSFCQIIPSCMEGEKKASSASEMLVQSVMPIQLLPQSPEECLLFIQIRGYRIFMKLP